MTKENFTKFLNEKQRDSRLNEELFPRLRQDQIKALIDKYEPCTSNTNRSKTDWWEDCDMKDWQNTSVCVSSSPAGLISPEGLLNFLMGPETTVVMQDRLAKCQDMSQPLPHYFVKSSHNTYLTGRTPLSGLITYFHAWCLRVIFVLLSLCLPPCSWSVLWCFVPGDVPPVSAVRLPLPGAGLLERKTTRWGANHHPRLHHDNWDPLQGVLTCRSSSPGSHTLFIWHWNQIL